MVGRRITTTLFGLTALSFMLVPGTVMAEGEKPKVLKPCMQCHAGTAENDIRGKFGSVSMKAETRLKPVELHG